MVAIPDFPNDIFLAYSQYIPQHIGLKDLKKHRTPRIERVSVVPLTRWLLLEPRVSQLQPPGVTMNQTERGLNFQLRRSRLWPPLGELLLNREFLDYKPRDSRFK